MKLRTFTALVLGLGITLPALASFKVQSVPDEGNHFLLDTAGEKVSHGERVCVIQKKKAVACGKVIKQTENISVEIDFRTTKIEKFTRKDNARNFFAEGIVVKAPLNAGDCVVRESEQQNPKACSSKAPTKKLATAEKTKSEPALKKESPAPGDSDQFEENLDRQVASLAPHTTQEIPVLNKTNITFGLNYVFPQVEYQAGVSDHFSLGVASLLISYPVLNGSLKGFAGFVSVNYYAESLFQGLWIQLSGGLHSLEAISGLQSERLTSPAVQSLVGWKWRWNSGVNFGFGAGIHYLVKPQPKTFTINFSGYWPAIAMQIGF